MKNSQKRFTQVKGDCMRSECDLCYDSISIESFTDSSAYVENKVPDGKDTVCFSNCNLGDGSIISSVIIDSSVSVDHIILGIDCSGSGDFSSSPKSNMFISDSIELEKLESNVPSIEINEGSSIIFESNGEIILPTYNLGDFTSIFIDSFSSLSTSSIIPSTIPILRTTTTCGYSSKRAIIDVYGQINLSSSLSICDSHIYLRSFSNLFIGPNVANNSNDGFITTSITMELDSNIIIDEGNLHNSGGFSVIRSEPGSFISLVNSGSITRTAALGLTYFQLNSYLSVSNGNSRIESIELTLDSESELYINNDATLLVDALSINESDGFSIWISESAHLDISSNNPISVQNDSTIVGNWISSGAIRLGAGGILAPTWSNATAHVNYDFVHFRDSGSIICLFSDHSHSFSPPKYQIASVAFDTVAYDLSPTGELNITVSLTDSSTTPTPPSAFFGAGASAGASGANGVSGTSGGNGGNGGGGPKSRWVSHRSSNTPRHGQPAQRYTLITLPSAPPAGVRFLLETSSAAFAASHCEAVLEVIDDSEGVRVELACREYEGGIDEDVDNDDSTDDLDQEAGLLEGLFLRLSSVVGNSAAIIIVSLAGLGAVCGLVVVRAVVSTGYKFVDEDNGSSDEVLNPKPVLGVQDLALLETVDIPKEHFEIFVDLYLLDGVFRTGVMSSIPRTLRKELTVHTLALFGSAEAMRLLVSTALESHLRSEEVISQLKNVRSRSGGRSSPGRRGGESNTNSSSSNSSRRVRVVRPESIPAQLFIGFTLLRGRDYLRQVLGGPISAVIASYKAEEDEEVMTGKMREVLLAVCGSSKLIPVSIQSIISTLVKTIRHTFPRQGYELEAIHSLFFAKVLGAAIRKPYIFGIVDEPVASGVTPALIAIARVLENDASGSNFGVSLEDLAQVAQLKETLLSFKFKTYPATNLYKTDKSAWISATLEIWKLCAKRAAVVRYNLRHSEDLVTIWDTLTILSSQEAAKMAESESRYEQSSSDNNSSRSNRSSSHQTNSISSANANANANGSSPSTRRKESNIRKINPTRRSSTKSKGSHNSGGSTNSDSSLSLAFEFTSFSRRTSRQLSQRGSPSRRNKAKESLNESRDSLSRKSKASQFSAGTLEDSSQASSRPPPVRTQKHAISTSYAQLLYSIPPLMISSLPSSNHSETVSDSITVATTSTSQTTATTNTSNSAESVDTVPEELISISVQM